MHSLRYTGMFNPDEIWQDNSAFYQKCIDQPYGIDNVLRTEDAAKPLALYKIFPPGQTHDRLIGHKIQIYKINNPSWQTKGKFLIPKGPLELIIDIDLGIELAKKEKPSYQEQVISENIEYKLPDGTIIRGQQIRQIALTESIWSKIEPYCILNKISISEKTKGYSFAINTQHLSKNPYLEFHISSYVKINTKVISQKKEIARAAFKKNKYTDTISNKLDHIIYSAT